MCDMKPNFKKLLAQVRLSSHDLEIEKGRIYRPKPIPAEQRFYHFCKDKVEDEVHSIADCATYSEIRQEFLSAHTKCLSSAVIFVSIFKSRNKVTLLNLGQFIEKHSRCGDN